ncbi:MAG: hypothetical protein GWM88_11095 [Pseudomonadales bacterium]|nr:hypothetical protein [Pseudomonadales bacterium]NIX08514.1 hypothetical protein [Pseudomonadales bacterium]
MQFADYVGSRALHMTSDCLRLLSSSALEDGVLTPGAASNLLGTVGRLESLWQLRQWSVGKADYRRAMARLREAEHRLEPAANWFDAVASQMLAKTDDAKTRRAVERARRAFARSIVGSEMVDSLLLSRLFQEESAVWRAQASDRGARDADLVDYGIGRAFDKSRRAVARLAENPGSTKRLRRAQRWVRHLAHHLELLQPALSEANEARAWFIGRLDANLTRRLDLARFMEVAEALPLKRKQLKRIRRVGQRLERRLIEQSGKLVHGAYRGGRGKALRALAQDVESLGPDEIVLLPLAGRAGASN